MAGCHLVVGRISQLSVAKPQKEVAIIHADRDGTIPDG